MFRQSGSHTDDNAQLHFLEIYLSTRRAIASSSVDGVCAMLNHSVTLIETQLAEGFKQSLRKGFPAQGYLDLNQVWYDITITL